MASTLHVVFILIFIIYLFTYLNWCQRSDHLFLFTYANRWWITCAFSFNIHYLFVYLFKVMSTKAAQVTTCFYLLMEITCWFHVVFVLIFIIYLFISSKRCQQKQPKSPPVFIYLCKWLLVRHGFRFNIHYLFVYLFKAMSTKASGTDHLFLFTYANW